VVSSSDELLCREALRIYRRYAVEVIEALNLCPWAERARAEGQVRERVLLQRFPDLDATLDVISELAVDPRVEVGLLIFPRLGRGRIEFDRYVAELQARDAQRQELGAIPFAMAAFHPEARPDVSDAERLIPFIRRSPDPTVQLVRRTTLERIREKTPQGTQFVDLRQLTSAALVTPAPRPLRQRIAEANRDTIRELGVEEIERRLHDIERDRRASYAGLGETD
jgi:hypothetical protein